MRNCFHAARFEAAGNHQSVHADAGHRAAVDVNRVNFSAGEHVVNLLVNSFERDAFWRIDFYGDDKFLFLDFFPDAAFRFAFRDAQRRFIDVDFSQMRREVRRWERVFLPRRPSREYVPALCRNIRQAIERQERQHRCAKCAKYSGEDLGYTVRSPMRRGSPTFGMALRGMAPVPRESSSRIGNKDCGPSVQLLPIT